MAANTLDEAVRVINEANLAQMYNNAHIDRATAAAKAAKNKS